MSPKKPSFSLSFTKLPKTIGSSLLDLIYPRICQSCGLSLYKNEDVLCLFCDARLPLTNYHLQLDNPVEQVFWGRINLHSASARHLYQVGGKVQHLVHQLKYKGKKEIGVYLGNKYGIELMKSPRFVGVQYIIPVPLHLKKMRTRGFNQSEMFGLGLAQTTFGKLDTTTLIRAVATETQTRKNRWERYKNTKEIFTLQNPEKLENKHVLLVDDVITTGSTIEGCVQLLKQINGIKISVVAIAAASH